MAGGVGLGFGNSFACLTVLEDDLDSASSDGHEDASYTVWSLSVPSTVTATPDAADSTVLTGLASRVGDPVGLVDDRGVVRSGAELLATSLAAQLVIAAASRTPSESTVPPVPLAVTVAHPDEWSVHAVAALRDELAPLLPMARDGLDLVPASDAVLAWVGSQVQLPDGAAVLVVDLGATRSSVVLLRCVRGTDGTASVAQRERPWCDDSLTGNAIDHALLRHVLDALGDELDTPLNPQDPVSHTALVELRAACTTAKEALSDDTSSDVEVRLPGLHTQVRIVRSELDAIVQPALVALLEGVRSYLEQSGVTAADLDRVVLLGGGAALPLVVERFSDALERPILVEPRPGLAVATGAARLAATREAALTAIGQSLFGTGQRADWGDDGENEVDGDKSRPHFTRRDATRRTHSLRERRARQGLVAAVALVAVGLGGFGLANRYARADVTPEAPSTQVVESSTDVSGSTVTTTPLVETPTPTPTGVTQAGDTPTAGTRTNRTDEPTADRATTTRATTPVRSSAPSKPSQGGAPTTTPRSTAARPPASSARPPDQSTSVPPPPPPALPPDQSTSVPPPPPPALTTKPVPTISEEPPVDPQPGVPGAAGAQP